MEYNGILKRYRSLQKFPPFSRVGHGTEVASIQANKTWFIECENDMGSIQGYITNSATAKTYEYAPEWRGAIYITVGKGGATPPVGIYNQLAAILHREFRKEYPEIVPEKTEGE